MSIAIPGVNLTPENDPKLYVANLRHLASCLSRVPLHHVATEELLVDDWRKPVPTNRHYSFGETAVNGSIYIMTRYEVGIPRITVLYSLHGVTMEVSFQYFASPYICRYIDAWQAIDVKKGLQVLELVISDLHLGRLQASDGGRSKQTVTHRMAYLPYIFLFISCVFVCFVRQ